MFSTFTGLLVLLLYFPCAPTILLVHDCAIASRLQNHLTCHSLTRSGAVHSCRCVHCHNTKSINHIYVHDCALFQIEFTE